MFMILTLTGDINPYMIMTWVNEFVLSLRVQFKFTTNYIYVVIDGN